MFCIISNAIKLDKIFNIALWLCVFMNFLQKNFLAVAETGNLALVSKKQEEAAAAATNGARDYR